MTAPAWLGVATAVWCVVSFPVGVVLGFAIKAGNAAVHTPVPDDDLCALIQPESRPAVVGTVPDYVPQEWYL